MTLKKGKIIIICRKMKEITCAIANHALLMVLFFIFISFIFGGLIFYQYFILAQKDLTVTPNNEYFNKEAYQQVLNKWSLREKAITESSQNVYLDPFKIKSLTNKNK